MWRWGDLGTLEENIFHVTVQEGGPVCGETVPHLEERRSVTPALLKASISCSGNV